MMNAIRPDHYKLTIYRNEDDKIGTEIQCIDVIEALGLGFHLGSALKYAWRLGRKHDRLTEEIEKCRWYLDRWHEKVWQEKTLSGMLFAEYRKLGVLLLHEREITVANDHEMLAGNLRGFCMVAEQHSEREAPSFDPMPYMLELIELFDLETQLCA